MGLEVGGVEGQSCVWVGVVEKKNKQRKGVEGSEARGMGEV